MQAIYFNAKLFHAFVLVDLEEGCKEGLGFSVPPFYSFLYKEFCG